MSGSPRIVGHPEHATSVERMPVNASIIKTYNIHGYPQPNSTWTFSSRSAINIPLKDTPERRIFQNQTTIGVEILQIKEEHFGTYNAEVKNNISVLHLQFELLPSGKYII